ncbi:MAG: hypothetical protein H8K10_06800 [Nitrospira sp.]|nr:hypothetical protein [Nitrospira sp.]
MHGVLVSLCLLSTLLSGCGLVTIARVSVNEPLSVRDVGFIRPNETTFTDLIARLGTPDEIVGSDEGDLAIYHFLDAKYSRINYGLVARVSSPVSPDLLTEGLGMGFDRLEVLLDSSWRVHHVGFARYHDRSPGFKFWPFGKQSVESSSDGDVAHAP